MTRTEQQRPRPALSAVGGESSVASRGSLDSVVAIGSIASPASVGSIASTNRVGAIFNIPVAEKLVTALLRRWQGGDGSR